LDVQSLRFLDVFDHMIDVDALEAICKRHAPLPRRPPKMTASQVVTGLIFHQLQEVGTLADHAAQLHGIRMTDPAHWQRRQLLPVELFDEIMCTALAPLGDPRLHKDCFYKGLRLIGVDGTQWSVINTPGIAKRLPKAASRRLESAFAKVRLVCATELGTHAPVAAAAAPASDGEQTVANVLWTRLPVKSLVIGDRLFGTAYTLSEALTATEGRGVEFLLRVKGNIRTKILKRLSDGSATVQVPVRDGGKVVRQLTLREVQAEGIGPDGKEFKLRLWTTLLDHKKHPAHELAKQYALRWECELYYRELKLDVRGTPVLASHTVETALQELAAVVLGSAVVARMRVDTADRLEVPVRRVSFYKLLHATRALWDGFRLARRALTSAVKRAMWKEYMEDVQQTAILPERRSRSCPRVLRQPVSKWPRKIDQLSHNGAVHLRLIRV
jgi:hypothetical protein